MSTIIFRIISFQGFDRDDMSKTSTFLDLKKQVRLKLIKR